MAEQSTVTLEGSGYVKSSRKVGVEQKTAWTALRKWRNTGHSSESKGNAGELEENEDGDAGKPQSVDRG